MCCVTYPSNMALNHVPVLNDRYTQLVCQNFSCAVGLIHPICFLNILLCHVIKFVNIPIKHSPVSRDRLIQYDYYIFSYILYHIHQICLLSFCMFICWILQICLLNTVWAKYRISKYQAWWYIQ
jgi:hypothetical protein